MAREMDLGNYGYQFTRNWHRNRNLSSFRSHVYPAWIGVPTTYLEIGVFELEAKLLTNLVQARDALSA